MDCNVLAAKMGLSVYEFRRIFSFIIGCPISEYIRKRRLPLFTGHGNYCAADAAVLGGLIYKNRFSNAEYLNILADCYTLSLMQAHNSDSQIAAAVKKIVNAISENACNPNFNIADELRLSGYAEDYIRAKFKEICKETPTEFLNRLRIKNACRIIEIYGKQFNITETAERCGFSNPAYFSRVFKKITGVSPNKYGAAGRRE